jgi:Ni/Co efflux regulator RcnB
LPPGIGYYALPPDLLRRLPPPPPHHRYVRVGPDILLIAIGTALVIDAIEDIGRY